MKIKKYALGILCVLGVMGICACSANSVQYDNYHKEVNTLYDKIVTTGAIIDNIDTDSDKCEEELYASLDELKDAFDEFAKVDTPKEFTDCKILAENASTYITNSEKCFKQAFDDGFNEDMFNTGVSNYNEVIKCVNTMGEILQNKK